MAVSRRLRYEILRRDNHACRYCGSAAPDVPLTVDHVVPVALGGGDQAGNLVTACRDCNSGKSASSPDASVVADVRADAERWAAAMQLAAERTAQTATEQDDLAEWFECIWTRSWLDDPAADDTSTRFRHPGRRYAPRGSDWRDSVIRFVAAGLDRKFMAKAVEKAMHAERVPFGDTWRYFCGICWRQLDDIRNMAAQLLADGEAGPAAGDAR